MIGLTAEVVEVECERGGGDGGDGQAGADQERSEDGPAADEAWTGRCGHRYWRAPAC